MKNDQCKMKNWYLVNQVSIKASSPKRAQAKNKSPKTHFNLRLGLCLHHSHQAKQNYFFPSRFGALV
ncbi:MAG TPA: hypothetical protein DCS93_24655 [Microscillaceae bacterium]|nr:hypothetical protein [Microscillaceae bacterium]